MTRPSEPATVHRPAPETAHPLKVRLYDIIFESDTPAGKRFDIGLLVLILLSVLIVSFETVRPIQAKYGGWLMIAEWCITLLFTVEYVLRLYCVRNARRYATSVYGIIDLMSILPTLIELMLTGSGSFAIVRMFRLLRVFRVLKMFQLTSDAEGLAQAVWEARGKIVVFLMFIVISVTVSGALMYEIESFANPDSQFTSIPQSIYWAVVTMTTVGYGDVVPKTVLGKCVSAILILVGYSLIIVPTGFVSAELFDSKRRRQWQNRTCPHCFLEGHDEQARFCRGCGTALFPNLHNNG